MIGKIIYWLISAYELLIILSLLKSFIQYFAQFHKNLYDIVSKLSFLDVLTDPFLNIFRKLGLVYGGLDFSPMIALFVLQLLEKLIIVKLF